MPLTLEEKAAVRYHLGYTNLRASSAANLGVPGVNQLGYILEGNFDLMLPEGEPHVRRCIQELECIEDQLSEDRALQKITKAGGTSFSGSDGMSELETQYVGWAEKLADSMGAELNPFSKRFQRLTGQIPTLGIGSGAVEIWG